MPVVCPKCHQVNRDSDDLCSFCGANLTLPLITSGGLNLLQGEQELGYKQCPSHPDARAVLEEGRMVCSKCGCDLGEPKEPKPATPANPPVAAKPRRPQPPPGKPASPQAGPAPEDDEDEDLDKVAYLEVEGGQEIFFRGAYTTRVPLKSASILVGRRDVMASHYPDIDLMMYRKLDPAISRRHLRFFREGEKHFIEDLCNNNATFLNDYSNKLNHERRELRHGDRIFVSMSLAFLFRTE